MRKDGSLVGATSFAVMRERDLDRAFAFDPQFAEEGFATS
jgi:predicted nucleic acid-binding protein